MARHRQRAVGFRLPDGESIRRIPICAWIVPSSPTSSAARPRQAQVIARRTRGSSCSRSAKGLPQEGAYETVLRDALAVDSLPATGVYFGTRSGKVFGSADEGESWSSLADGLPPVISVKTAVV